MIKAFQIAILIVLSVMFASCGGGQKDGIKWTRGPMPAEGNFDGVYQSDFGRMELTVSGDGVVGLYENDAYNGRIQGEIRDNIMEFTWTQWNQEMRGKVRETTGRGLFQYITEDVSTGTKMKKYHSLKGWWGYPGGDLANRWNGSKLSARAKKRLVPFVPEQGEMDGNNDVEASGFQDMDTPATETESAPAEEEEQEDEGGIDDIF